MFSTPSRAFASPIHRRAALPSAAPLFTGLRLLFVGLFMAGMTAIPLSAQSGSPVVQRGESHRSVSAVKGTGTPAMVPTRVLVIGTYHFANPGLDIIKSEVADVSTPEKQAEIQRVADAIAAFAPTHVAVEQLPASGPLLDSLYLSFRSGDRALSRSETQQLGFRIAAQAGLGGVHPVDHPGAFPMDAVMAYAVQHDPAFVQLMQREMGRITMDADRRQQEQSVGEILWHLNAPETLAEAHGLYLQLGRVGAGDGYAGAELLAKWYERNLRIFANLTRLAESGGRVVVIIGSGHAPILRELIAGHPGLELIDAHAVLPRH